MERGPVLWRERVYMTKCKSAVVLVTGEREQRHGGKRDGNMWFID